MDITGKDFVFKKKYLKYKTNYLNLKSRHHTSDSVEQSTYKYTCNTKNTSNNLNDICVRDKNGEFNTKVECATSEKCVKILHKNQKKPPYLDQDTDYTSELPEYIIKKAISNTNLQTLLENDQDTDIDASNLEGHYFHGIKHGITTLINMLSYKHIYSRLQLDRNDINEIFRRTTNSILV